jgi:hypothetical protein
MVVITFIYPCNHVVYWRESLSLPPHPPLSLSRLLLSRRGAGRVCCRCCLLRDVAGETVRHGASPNHTELYGVM